MVLTRIWSAFIIIAIIVAGIKCFFFGETQIFSWMVSGKAAPAADAKCEAPNDEVVELGHKLGIQGTPAIFFADGSRIPGAIDAKSLEEKFSKVKQ